MKLISNTLFGKYCKSKEKEFSRRIDYLDWYEKTRNNFDEFLEQPLKLERFIPCDDEGDVLEVPTNYEKRLLNMMTEYNDEVYTYYQAKVKVLFEGFNLNQKDFSKLESIFCLTKECFQITFFTKEKGCFMDSLKTNKTYEIKTIEDLIQFELELTESAIKQIGL